MHPLRGFERGRRVAVLRLQHRQRRKCQRRVARDDQGRPVAGGFLEATDDLDRGLGGRERTAAFCHFSQRFSLGHIRAPEDVIVLGGLGSTPRAKRRLNRVDRRTAASQSQGQSDFRARSWFRPWTSW